MAAPPLYAPGRVASRPLLPNSAAAGPASDFLVPTVTSAVTQTTVTAATWPISNTQPFFQQLALADLGYGERTLNSPYSSTDYSFRLPAEWHLGYSELDLDLSYSFTGSTTTETLALLGDILILVDGELQTTVPIQESSFEHWHLSVPLSADLNGSGRSHVLTIVLDASYICRIPHRAHLTVHSTSSISFGYDRIPIVPDLGLYPWPLVQQALEPDRVQFVLPAQPTALELTEAAAIAARLGRLASSVLISGTTDAALLRQVSSRSTDEVQAEHLIVIGAPEGNAVIEQLGDLHLLPVEIRPRQLDLISQGPAGVRAGDILTYTLTVTNTSSRRWTNLALVDTLPPDTTWQSCRPQCIHARNQVTWTVSSLERGQSISYELGLQMGESGSILAVENTAALIDPTLGPLNVTTLTATMGLESDGKRHSARRLGDTFFVLDGQAVPENDGVVQVLVSPWDSSRAIVVATGLTDDAVSLASQALSTPSRYPGIKGAAALVRMVQPVLSESEANAAAALPAPDQSFADLGYNDVVLYGAEHRVTYRFSVPAGWALGEDSTLYLDFKHSQLIDYAGSFLTVSLNDRPIASVPLDRETAGSGQLVAKLPSSDLSWSIDNRIVVEAVTLPLDPCADLDVWLMISKTSHVYLELGSPQQVLPSLNDYPWPFGEASGLANTMFVLPDRPSVEEWERVLHMAAQLGAAAGPAWQGGTGLAPQVVMAEDNSTEQFQGHHLIVLGRPLRNRVLQQMNADLPQPFQSSWDEIEQRLDHVVYRLPAGLSLGILELAPSPWSDSHIVLVATGTTDEGVRWAIDLLDQRWKLGGNLVFVRQDQASSVDTRALTGSGAAIVASTAVSQVLSTATTTETLVTVPVTPTLAAPTPVSPAMAVERSQVTTYPVWLYALVGVTGVVVIAILVYAFWQVRKRST